MTEPINTPESIASKTSRLKTLLHTFLEKQLNYNTKLFQCLRRTIISDQDIQTYLAAFQNDLILSETRFDEVKVLLQEILDMEPSVPETTLPTTVLTTIVPVKTCQSCANIKAFNIALLETDPEDIIYCCNIDGLADTAFGSLPRDVFISRFKIAFPESIVCGSYTANV